MTPDKKGAAEVAPFIKKPPYGDCDNPRCVCNRQCMMREVEEFWGTDAAKKWADGLKDEE